MIRHTSLLRCVMLPFVLERSEAPLSLGLAYSPTPRTARELSTNAGLEGRLSRSQLWRIHIFSINLGLDSN